jgi:hypothetical protein
VVSRVKRDLGTAPRSLGMLENEGGVREMGDGVRRGEEE